MEAFAQHTVEEVGPEHETFASQPVCQDCKAHVLAPMFTCMPHYELHRRLSQGLAHLQDAS